MLMKPKGVIEEPWQGVSGEIQSPKSGIREPKVEGGMQKGGQTCTFTIIPVAHTTPHRLPVGLTRFANGAILL